MNVLKSHQFTSLYVPYQYTNYATKRTGAILYSARARYVNARPVALCFPRRATNASLAP